MVSPVLASGLGLAAKKAVEFMVSTYKRKYGKYGEKVVRKLKRELAAAHQAIKGLIAENRELNAQVIAQDQLIEKMQILIEELEAKYHKQLKLANQRLAIIEVRKDKPATIDPSPYEEVE